MSTSGPNAGRLESISGEQAHAYTLQPIPPQPFGRYTLIGRLGQGGMAEVLLAVMAGKGGFRKLVVLKRLHPQLQAEPGFVAMFLDEARLAAQLDHPHCVQTLEVGEVDGQHFLAMEYLDGQGLDRLLRASASSGQPLPVPVAVRIVADALDGLGHAHELTGFDGRPLGIVHRDVSPQNTFITYSGVVKLLDFGIAKAESNVVETRTGVIKGKYAYIAPEQALGHPVDRRADLWSMGVVLWECLTSRRLFKSTNEIATLQETLHGEIKPPSHANPAIPPALDEIVMHALQREPDRRYQSATEFKEALEAWLATQPSLPTRRAIAQLMKERFAEVQRAHKEKLASCLAALDVGPSGIHHLVEGSSVSSTTGEIASPEAFAQSTPSISRSASARRPTHAGPEAARTAEARRRALAWRLVLVGAVAVLAAIVAIVLPRSDGERRPPGLPGTANVPSPAASTRAPAPAAATASPPASPASEAVASAPAASPVAGQLAPAASSPAAEVAAASEPVAGGDRRRPPRRRPPREPSPAPAAPAQPPASAPDGAQGFLSLVTSPWTTVTVGGRVLGDTPLVRVPLPAGRHTLRLVNEAEGISETYEVEIRPGELTTRRLGLR